MESILSGHGGDGSEADRDFDTLFDTKANRILRVLIPFFPVAYQPALVVWLRFSQLQYALAFLKGKRPCSGFQEYGSFDLSDPEPLFSRLKPCLSPEECREMERMQNMLSMYQRFKQLEPLLSKLGGLSEDMSMADMMNAFSGFQGQDDSSISNILDLMSMFRSEPDPAADESSAPHRADTADEQIKSTERKEQDHEQGLDER